MRNVMMAIVALAAAAAPLRAQRTQSSGGFWYGAGLGSGWTRVACDLCRSSRGTAVSGFVRLGGRVRPGLLVGAEGSVWKKGDGGIDETLFGLSANAYVYPRRGNFYWKAGAGLLSYRNDDNRDVLTSTALGLHLGAGYDLRVRDGLYLSPYASVMVASLGGEVKFNGADILSKANLSLIQAGIGISRR